MIRLCVWSTRANASGIRFVLDSLGYSHTRRSPSKKVVFEKEKETFYNTISVIRRRRGGGELIFFFLLFFFFNAINLFNTVRRNEYDTKIDIVYVFGDENSVRLQQTRAMYEKITITVRV